MDIAKGEQAGCASHCEYTRDVPQADGSKARLNFDDWFFRIDERACIVRGSAGRVRLRFVTAHVTYRTLREVDGAGSFGEIAASAWDLNGGVILHRTV
jgi:hypothetical protein